MKDKILCALKNNVLRLKGGKENYYFSTNNTFIDLWAKKLYTKTVTVSYSKTWWGKTVEKETTKSNHTGTRYYVSAYNKEYDITEEEYQDIIDYRKSEIKKAQEKELNSLCKDE